MSADRLSTTVTALPVLTAGAVGALVASWPGAVAGAGLAVAVSYGIHRLLALPAERRERLLAAPFPLAWRRVLEERSDHYDRLPPLERRRFEDAVRVFLAGRRITGIEVEATDEHRLLVAASAATLSLAWDYEWEQVTEVLLYPQDFGRDYSFDTTDLSGEAHAWGTVILSVPSLEESFADPDDGYHVGLHEFAHLLDMDETRFDGLPAGLPEERAAEWLAVLEGERERLRHGRSVLDSYGADDTVELFAVAVEAFFERPLALRRRHRELYGLLRDYFAQDPAAWDDARGSRKADGGGGLG